MISFEEVVNESNLDKELEEYKKLGYIPNCKYSDKGIAGWCCSLSKNGEYLFGIKGKLHSKEESQNKILDYIKKDLQKSNKPLLESTDFNFLNEEEKIEVENAIKLLNESDLNNLDEGIISNILSGIGGFIIGPAIGKVIANALGIEKGILYDMLTSRLVSAALGSAVSKAVIK